MIKFFRLSTNLEILNILRLFEDVRTDSKRRFCLTL